MPVTLDVPALFKIYPFYPQYPMWEHEYPLNMKPRTITAETPAYVQRSRDGININQRTTRLSYKSISYGEKEILKKFIEDRGAVEAFIWQPAGDSEVSLWRALKFTWGPVEKNFIDLDVDLEEVGDLAGLASEAGITGGGDSTGSSVSAIVDKVVDDLTNVVPPITAIYLEAQITSASSGVFGDTTGSPLLGLANASFNRDNPWQLDVNLSSIPSLDGGVFWQFRTNSSTVGWGYPVRGSGSPNFVSVSALNQHIGVAIRLDLGKLWMRNLEIDPAVWWGSGIGVHDPVTGDGGWDYSSTGPSPISGPVYILAGAISNGTSYVQGGFTVNFGNSAFTGALPTGFNAAKDIGVTHIDTATTPPDSSGAPQHKLIFSTDKLSMSGGYIIGSNGPTAFALSNAPIGVAP